MIDEFQEMQELEKELKALYQEQKEATQAEVSATKAAIATRYIAFPFLLMTFSNLSLSVISTNDLIPKKEQQRGSSSGRPGARPDRSVARTTG